MLGFGRVGLLCIAFTCGGPASAAAGVDTTAAIQRYCESLVAGTAAAQVGDIARKDGFTPEVANGQPFLRSGELLVALSDTPRVCFVQSPTALTFEQGVALVDTWAARHPGSVRSPATRGPDGAPVRGWNAPTQKMAIVMTQQRNGMGQNVMAFILMPLPSKGK